MLAYIAGVVVVNLAVGVGILVGPYALVIQFIDQIPAHLVWSGELLIGVMLLGVGLWIGRSGLSQPAARQPRSLRPRHTFLLGMVITLQEVSTAFPYLVAIDRLATQQFHILTTVLLLCLYNAIYVMPLLALIAGFVLWGERYLPQLVTINERIGCWLPRVIQVVVFGLGAFFVIDALAALS